MSSRFSKSDSSISLPDFVAVGSVRKPHGVRGEVTIDVLSEVEGRIAPGEMVDLVSTKGARQSVLISSVRGVTGGSMIVRFDGIDDRDQSAQLQGAVLEVSRSRVPKAPEGAFYFFEMVGCICVDEQKGELGRVKEIIEDGGGLLLEIDSGSRTLLVPFVRAYVTQLDVAARRIEVDLPEGLIETCTSKS